MSHPSNPPILLLCALTLAVAASACDDKSDKSDNAGKKDTQESKPADKVAESDKGKAADKTDKDAGDKVADAKADEPAKADGEAPVDDAKAEGGQAVAEGGEALPPPPTDAGAEGPAYFAVRDRGLVQLAGGKFTVVANSPTILLRDLAVAADGKLYLLGSDGIMRIDGTTANMVAETTFKTTGSVDAFAVTKDSATIWAVGYKGVSKWSGGNWATEEKTVLGADVTLVKGVVVDASDRVWVASSNKIHTREGDKWVDVDTAKVFERKPFFDMMRRSPDGVAYALASGQLVKLNQPDAIDEIDLKVKGFATLGYLAFADNGAMALRTGIDEVTLVGKGSWKAGKDFTADQIRGVGVDGQGRVWVASDIGVAVLGPGEAKVEWNSGSVLELAGQVEHIVVLGAGPALPEVGAVKTGGLKGKILTDGKGVADTDVELCPSPDMMFDKSPCDDSPVKFAGKTDAEGNFAFDAVPIGAYGVSVKVEGKWQLTMASNFGTKMKEGESYDIGSITVKAK